MTVDLPCFSYVCELQNNPSHFVQPRALKPNCAIENVVEIDNEVKSLSCNQSIFRLYGKN